MEHNSPEFTAQRYFSSGGWPLYYNTHEIIKLKHDELKLTIGSTIQINNDLAYNKSIYPCIPSLPILYSICLDDMKPYYH